MVLELVYLLVVKFLGVYGCVWVDVELFSEADECELVFEAFDPVVKCGYGDLGFVLAFHGCLGLLEGVAKVEVCECLEDDGCGVRGVLDKTVGESVVA